MVSFMGIPGLVPTFLSTSKFGPTFVLAVGFLSGGVMFEGVSYRALKLLPFADFLIRQRQEFMQRGKLPCFAADL